MANKIDHNGNTYSVPETVIFRGKKYEIEGHWTSRKSRLEKYINSYKNSESKYIIKKFKANTKSGKPLLYVSYWIE